MLEPLAQIGEVIGKVVTDETPIDLLVAYWGADRLLDPGPDVDLARRLASMDSSIVEVSQAYRCVRPRFFLEQDEALGITWFMQPPDWTGSFGFGTLDSEAVFQRPQGGEEGRLPRSGRLWLVVDSLLNDLRLRAAAGGTVESSDPASLGRVVGGLDRVGDGNWPAYWVGDNVMVTGGGYVWVSGIDRGAVAAVAEAGSGSWRWRWLPTMAELWEARYGIAGPVEYSPDVDYAKALLAEPAESAVEGFCRQWFGTDLPPAAPAAGEPELLARLRAIDRACGIYSGFDILLPHGRPVRGLNENLVVFRGFDLSDTAFAYDSGSVDSQVWRSDDSEEAWRPLGMSLMEFLRTDVVVAALHAAPAVIRGTVDDAEHAEKLLASFEFVDHWHDTFDTDGVYASEAVIVYRHGPYLEAGARHRGHFLETSLARSGRWD